MIENDERNYEASKEENVRKSEKKAISVCTVRPSGDLEIFLNERRAVRV